MEKQFLPFLSLLKEFDILFDIGSDTILWLIAAIVDDDKLHNPAKKFQIYTIRKKE